MAKVKTDRTDTLNPFMLSVFIIFSQIKTAYLKLSHFHFPLQYIANTPTQFSYFLQAFILGLELSVYTNKNTKCFLKFQYDSWKYLCLIYNCIVWVPPFLFKGGGGREGEGEGGGWIDLIKNLKKWGDGKFFER